MSRGKSLNMCVMKRYSGIDSKRKAKYNFNIFTRKDGFSMKKVITVCLCLILALSVLSVACAEDFTIHAGTMFGDTLEEVKAKENLEIYDDYVENQFGRKITYIGDVAGYSNTLVIYEFDDNGKVYDVRYSIDILTNDANQVMANYKALESALTKKYGEPLSNDDEDNYIIIGKQIEIIQKGNETKKIYGFPEDKYEYKSWVYPCEDYSVKIELIKSIGQDSTGPQNACYISYHYYTDEDYEKAKEAYKKIEIKINDDL